MHQLLCHQFYALKKAVRIKESLKALLLHWRFLRKHLSIQALYMNFGQNWDARLLKLLAKSLLLSKSFYVVMYVECKD